MSMQTTSQTVDALCPWDELLTAPLQETAFPFTWKEVRDGLQSLLGHLHSSSCRPYSPVTRGRSI